MAVELPAINHRLDVLDGLRGIAIIQVVWVHLWQISWLAAPFAWLQFIPETGAQGVRLFFFLSGFVVAYPFIQAQFGQRVILTWQHFAYRRALKIIPSLVLSLVVILMLGWTVPAFQSTREALLQIASNLLFVSVWFPSTYGSINGVLWSLAVEVQFYAVFPLLWWFFKRYPYSTAIWGSVVAILYRMWAEGSSQSYYLMDQLPGHLDLFLGGMVCAYTFVRLTASEAPLRARYAGLWTGLGVAGFAGYVLLLLNLMAVAHSNVPYEAGWQNHWAVYGRTGMTIALYAAALGSLCAWSWWQNIVGNKLLVFLSLISYNLYLFHLPIARALLMHAGLFGTEAEHSDYHWQVYYTWTALTVGILIASAVTYGFERPLLKLKLVR